MHTTYWSGNLKRRDQLGHLRIRCNDHVKIDRKKNDAG